MSQASSIKDDGNESEPLPPNPPSVPGSLPGGSVPVSRKSSRVSAPGSTTGPPPADTDGYSHGLPYAEEAASIINRLVSNKEKVRSLALGDKYESVKLDDKMLAEAAEDFRQAKMYNQLRLNEGMRIVELEERLKLVNVEEKIVGDERERLGNQAEKMMRKARRMFNKEAEAARWLEQEKYESDKKFIVDAERERLVRKRRAFELATEKVRASHPAHGSADRGDIILVMTVALGPTSEEVLTVREGDDFHTVATQFASTHRLPNTVINPLVDEITRNVARPSRSPSTSSVYDRLYRKR
eukprot:TRINITY_DN30513_c0_g1_i1.p1 TRINITY_DN30513_c0_g1~~TRINITY_DN30513_c0_g1_i1.p1  ORF type:complete len:314 (+),score=73.78 TRINITY_DN30513_c0_g1_i1:50-943(+)